MDAAESAILSRYRTRIRAGENLNPGEVADFEDLIARASAGDIISISYVFKYTAPV
jgi:hypothetical protein